ncbi:hypothetical protein [uncultured Methanolobus sp.]|uniref:hypothetical protein n=1 Tax=uncultured Methanolobus sp. TaxID=218300 RepID=UPI002AAC0571|nr:hypothetical protein [uncultured Methanolobus sp.]
MRNVEVNALMFENNEGRIGLDSRKLKIDSVKPPDSDRLIADIVSKRLQEAL